MKPVHELLDEYNDSHQNRQNKILHWLCVPVIVFSLLGMLWLVPLPELHFYFLQVNAASLLLIVCMVYYLLLCWRLAIGMLLFSLLLYLLLAWLDMTGKSGLALYLVLFVVAWAGQFIGHYIEKKRPSFLRDIQFLLIGPLWLMSAIYRRLNISY